ncbi:porin family protein [Bernardetia litoralis]|nr:porin family protein [Bernardetia litoralis]
MKKIFFLSLLFCLALTYQLQAQGFSYSGFKTGLSVARAPISFDGIQTDTTGQLSVESESSNGKFRTGLQFGVFAGKEFTKTIGVRMELNYTQMGRVDTINYNQRNNYALHYFSFDPMLQLRIKASSPNHFYILAGPSARLLVGSGATGTDEVQALKVRQADLGVNFGFSYLVGLTPYLYLTLEARAYYGLMNVAEKPKENAVELNEYISAFNTVQNATDPFDIPEETSQVIEDARTNGFNNNYKITNQGALFSIGFCVPLRPPADKLIKIGRK